MKKRVDLRLWGYGLVLAPPALLAWSVHSGHPWWTFLLFVAASPITRALFGVHSQRESVISERAAAVLNWLPAVYAASLTVALWSTAIALRTVVFSMPELIGLGLSLWTVLVFGLFPSHELLHRPSRASIRLGSAVAGMCGYPVWGLEHATHHARPGACDEAEWPRPDESVWQFVHRRTPVAIKNAIAKDESLRRVTKWTRGTSPLVVGVASLLLVSVVFTALAGMTGLIVYGVSAASVALSAQIMTYVQHWGLGDGSIPDARLKELAWEDDCLMQAWLTLNNSFHLAHHRDPQVPYYFLRPSEDSPRQPGCYVAMLGVCVVPPLWNRLMLPVLASYKRDERYVCAPGRRAICITPSRLLRAAPVENETISHHQTTTI